MRYILAAGLVLATTAAQAQTFNNQPFRVPPVELYTTIPDGFGGAHTIGPNGYIATTQPDGFGGSYTTVFPGQPPLPTFHFPEAGDDR